MWEKEISTQATESEGRGGGTLTAYSVKHSLKVDIALGSSLNQCLVSVRYGDYEYASEWLELSPLLDRVGTAQLLREGLGHFLLHATLPYTKQQTSWPPLELISLLYKRIEHLLA